MSLINYFRETKTELRQVKWPSRRQAVSYTLVVIALSLGVTVLLGAFDVLFSRLLQLVWN